MATFGTFTDNTTLKAVELNDLFNVVNLASLTLTQSNSLNVVSSGSYYWTVNKVVFFNLGMTICANGTANNPFVLTLPVTASSGSFRAVGFGRYFDASATDIKLLVPVKASTTTLQFLSDDGTSLTDRFGVNPAVTADNGDTLVGWVRYEAA